MEERINIFGVNVSLVNQDLVFKKIITYNFNNPGYLCFPDVNLIVQANQNPHIANILNNSVLTCPDGKPLEFYAKVKGYKNILTVSGYWLIRQLFDSDLEHYFYGTDEETLKKMISKITEEFPRAKIAGYNAPPFIKFEDIENNHIIMHDIKEINRIRPHIIWIGISSPKQDALMYHFHKQLDYGLMIGVGAVFNYISGDIKISPEWMKRLSIRWVYRLIQEPARLFPKIITSFSYFIILIIKEFISRILNIGQR